MYREKGYRKLKRKWIVIGKFILGFFVYLYDRAIKPL